MCWIPRSEQRQTVLQPSTHSLAFSRMARSARHHFVDRVDALARMLHPVELYGGWCGMGDLRLVWPIRNGDGVWQFQLRKDGIKHEYRASNTPGTYPEAKTLRDMWEEEAEPAVPGTEKTFLHSATISKLLPLDSRGTAHQHNTTRRGEEVPEDSVIRLGPGCMSQGPGCMSLPL